VGGMSSVARIVRPQPHRLQLVPQSPLPKVPRCGGAGLACRTRGRSAAGRLFPRGLHTARRDLSDRLPEQRGRLRPAVPHGGGNAAHDRPHGTSPWAEGPTIPSTSARIGATAVLHTWGSALTHHPHVHIIVPGGGISLDGTRWVGCKPGFLLPVPVLSRLFRRLFLTALADAHAAGRLAFFGEIEGLRRRVAFAAHLAPLKRKDWFVYAKPPFAGPQAVLAYLARYTHRVAIANSRLIALDQRGVTFRYKDYRRNGQARYRTMTLSAEEFIRRFLLHVLPKGFHRIRHYGRLASASCKANIARAKELIAAPIPQVEPPAAHDTDDPNATPDHSPLCPCCGGRMIVVEVFARASTPRGPPSSGTGIRI
jgi:hypothetical protein